MTLEEVLHYILFIANKYIFSGIYNLKMELCVQDLTYLDIRLKMKQFVFKKSIVIIL